VAAVAIEGRESSAIIDPELWYRRPMLYAMRIGPLLLPEGGAPYAFLGITDAGHVVAPLLTHHDAKGLRHLAAQAQGEELRCEPGLVHAGREFGFKAGPMPESAIPMRASFVLGVGIGKVYADVRNPDLLLDLAQAAAEFWRARPFDHWTDEQAIEIELAGAMNRTVEASILGNGGQEYGLALYFEPGGIQKIVRAVDQGRPEKAAAVEALAMTLDDEPAFAVEALDAAYGLPRVPIAMRSGRELRSVNELELSALTAAVRAVAKLTPGMRDTTAVAEVEGMKSIARVRAPEPDA
jgi:hypothetical protein